MGLSKNYLTPLVPVYKSFQKVIYLELYLLMRVIHTTILINQQWLMLHLQFSKKINGVRSKHLVKKNSYQ